jgi:hypothetical protein
VSEVEQRDRIAVEFTSEEALVLFEWLARTQNALEGTFVDQAEQRVLWDLESMLERELVAPFRADYDRLLRDARDALRDTDE